MGARDSPEFITVIMQGHKPNVEWSAIPNAAISETQALLYQFQESEWWSADQVLDHQLHQLAPLWKYKTNVELGLKRTLLIVEDDFRSNGSIPYSAGDGV